MGGFNATLRDLVKRKLGDYPVSRVSTAAEVRGELEGGSVSLLVLDQEIDGGCGCQVLEEVRRVNEWDAVPILYFASRSASPEISRELMPTARVSGILLPPLDAHELARQAACLVGVSLVPSSANADPRIEQVLADARTRFLGTVLERIETIDQAGAALLEGRLRPELRDAARREAHKLAGLLGTLGFGAGSRFALEIEEMLEVRTPPDRAEGIRYSELAFALRLEIERSNPGGGKGANEAPEKLTTVIIADQNDEFSDSLEAEALNRGVRVRRAKSFEEARSLVADAAPEAVVADLALSGREEDGLSFLESLVAQEPPVPTLILTSKHAFTDRVEVARRGGRGFLSRSLSPPQVLDAVLTLVGRLHAADTKILAVDDDPQVLDLLVSMLEPRGISMRALSDARQFWPVFEAFTPDLVILDVDMPVLSGVELCRVVRNDARRAETPIIFLTRYNDPETIQRVFSSGADDFVAKPIVGPELLTRIFNRLERVRTRRSLSETDFLTGALNRRKSMQAMAGFLELSRRHEQPFSFASIEVENLTRINQDYGRAAGDAALQEAAHGLRRAFRSEEVFARWGGDEFAVGMYGLTRYDGVQRLSELLDRICREKLKAENGAEFQLRLNAGVAQYPEDGCNLDELHRAAETARREARNAGGGRAVPAGWTVDQRETAKRVDVALVMSDEAQASLLLHTLESRGCRVRWLPDGAAAERLLSGVPPALQSKVVFVEGNLRDFDGFGLLKKLASNGALRETRVVMLTAPSVTNEAQAALELGAFDCVAQPLNPQVAARHISRALDAF